MFSKGLTIDDTDRILPLTKRVVYFTDNCGEIVFDRLLLEYLHANGSEITLVVRDAPILNDATMEEAEQFGLRDFQLPSQPPDAGLNSGCGLISARLS